MLDVLFWGLKALLWLSRPLLRPRDQKITIVLSKKEKKISCIFFFFNFWSSKPWIRIRNRICIRRIRIHDTNLVLPGSSPVAQAWCRPVWRWPGCTPRPWTEWRREKAIMELDLKKFYLGSMCTSVLIDPSLTFGLICEGAIGQQR